jgi:hypothetical protein
METFLVLLRRFPLIGVPIALIAEFASVVLSYQKVIEPPSLVWVLFRYTVLISAVSMCLFVLARWFHQRRLLKAQRHALFAGLLAVICFFCFLDILSYCTAVVSCVALLSVELKSGKSPRKRQQRKSSVDQVQLCSSAVPKSPQRKALPAVPRQLRRMSGPSRLPTVLLVHCEKDRPWREKCHEQLGIFEARGMLALWDESKIPAGSHRQLEMERALSAARVVILLVSAGFLSERFAQLHRILSYQKNRQNFWIYPVIVSPCCYEESPLHEFQPYWSSANTAHRPLKKLCLASQEESFCDLARDIGRRLGICAGARSQVDDGRIRALMDDIDTDNAEALIERCGQILDAIHTGRF